MNHSIPFAFKSADVSSAGEFAGYAAVFGNVDLGGDVIVAGAFSDSLDEHKQRNSMPALLWSHNASVVIGKLLTAREDRKGLYVEARLSLATKAAAEAYALLRDGAVGGMSIGYTVPDGGWKFHGDARHLKKIQLHEASVVAVPMNPDARVTLVKSAMDCTSIREFEDLTRDAYGLSNRLARKVASAAWPLISARDESEIDRDDREAQAKDIAALVARVQSFKSILRK